MIWFAFIIGLIIGFTICLIARRKPSCGVLHIDVSDPDDGPYMFLELSKNLPEIATGKCATFNIGISNFTSQK